MSRVFSGLHHVVIECLVLSLVFVSSIHAAIATLQETALSLSRSWTGITRYQGALSILHNPALTVNGMSFDHGFSGSIIPEIEMGSAATALVYKPAAQFGIGCGWNILSDGVWNEQTLALSCSWEGLPGLSLGAQARLVLLSMESETLAVIPCDFGLVFEPFEGLSFALTILAFNQPRLSPSEQVPSSIQAALAFELASSLTLGAGLRSDYWGLDSAFSCSWKPLQGLALHTSLEPASPTIAFGCSVQFGDFMLDLGSRLSLENRLLTHAVSLGFSPAPKTLAQRSGKRVNINTASRPLLLSLPGMTRRLAGRIIKERETRPFASVQDLVRVNGITRRIVLPLTNRAVVMDSGTNVYLLTNARGQTSWINGMEIRHLMARGIRADLARRIILLRNSLNGFFDPAELALLPGGETNWVPLVFGGSQ